MSYICALVYYSFSSSSKSSITLPQRTYSTSLEFYQLLATKKEARYQNPIPLIPPSSNLRFVSPFLSLWVLFPGDHCLSLPPPSIALSHRRGERIDLLPHVFTHSSPVNISRGEEAYTKQLKKKKMHTHPSLCYYALSKIEVLHLTFAYSSDNI